MSDDLSITLLEATSACTVSARVPNREHSTFVVQDIVVPASNGFNESLSKVVAILEKYHCDRSRPPSPRPKKDRQTWLRNLPSSESYDEDMINIFLNKFQQHIVGTFTTFANLPSLFPTMLRYNSARNGSAPLGRESKRFGVSLYAWSLANHETVFQRRLPLLSAIAIFSWPVTPRDSCKSPWNSIWSLEFIELALNRWIQAQETDRDSSTLMLFHLANVCLHVDFQLLQGFAHAHLRSNWSAVTTDLYSSLSQWARSKDCDIALWHTNALLQTAKASITSFQGQHLIDLQRNTPRTTNAGGEGVV